MTWPAWGREGTGGSGGGTVDSTARNLASANTTEIQSNDADIAALQAALNTVNADNATQTELDAVTAAQAILDGAQDGNITANASDIATLQAGLAAVNADNLTQTESDALVSAQASVDAAQDTLIAANASDIAALQAAASASLEDYMGVASTFAGLPVGLQANDYAILDTDDGANLAGVYIWDGSAYVFGFPLAEVLKKGSDLTGAATVDGNAEYTVSAASVAVTLPAAVANSTILFAVSSAGSMTLAASGGDTLAGVTAGAASDVVLVKSPAAGEWIARVL